MQRVARRPSIGRRVLINRGLPWTYVRAAIGGARHARLFDQVEAFCMFIGYPRSGHSLVGSLLDAHPEAVIAHELDALRFVRGGFRRNQLYELVLANDRAFTAQGRLASTGDYEYAVPNQWQGRFQRLRLIGDKQGGRSTMRLGERPALLERLRRTVGVPVRFVHVVRNPYDNISTILRRGGRRLTLDAAVDDYFDLVAVNGRLRAALDPGEVLDVRHEDLIARPGETIDRLLRFVALQPPPGYVDDCASILFASPSRTRDHAPWTPELRQRVDERIAAVEFLAGYTFD